MREVVLGGLAEHEWAADPRSRGVVEGLLGGIDLTRRSVRLSGGERRRSRWPPCSSQHDLLLLDEPTNHLDVEAIAWLAGHLRAPRRALVVTHDRWFLDAVMRRRPGRSPTARCTSYEGGYAAYVLARAERDRHRRRPIEDRRQQPAAQGAGLAAPRAAGPDVASRSSGSRRPTR